MDRAVDVHIFGVSAQHKNANKDQDEGVRFTVCI